MSLNCFATCAKGTEYPLATELEKLGATEVVQRQGGVSFDADTASLYRILLWSRVASRILLQIAEGAARDAESIAKVAYEVDWPQWFDTRSRLSIQFQGTDNLIRSPIFGAQCVKDGMFARLREDQESVPEMENHAPDVLIRARYHRQTLSLFFDLTGFSLHERGYRDTSGTAPIRENLAAAVVMRSGWLEDSDKPLIDPMCGSGTLLIEAAQMALGIPPRPHRQDDYLVTSLRLHQDAVWREMQAEVAVRARKQHNKPLVLKGHDLDYSAIEVAKQNALKAGVAFHVDFKQIRIEDNTLTGDDSAYMVCNPPYGERLGDQIQVAGLYRVWAQKIAQHFIGRMTIITSAIELLPLLGLRAEHRWSVMNGNLECQICQYQILKHRQLSENQTGISGSADAFVNRLLKNDKKIEKWAARVPTTAYRIYDADLPEYNVSVDRYGDELLIQEYAPPKKVDERKANARLLDVITMAPKALGIDPAKVHLKTRKIQRGTEQYEKLEKQKVWRSVYEYGLKMRVNLSDYLDTGLFLDHRWTRHQLSKLSKDAHFLNLFCYTASATVHAAAGGAASTTSVDMSRTYLDWGERNLKQNDFRGRNHHFVQAEVFTFLKNCEQKFDLVFCDPPTFSNSKRMQGTLDVQRDHIGMLTLVKNLLHPGGKVVFSNNYRKFKLDVEAVEALGFKITDWCHKSIPEDFKRNNRIHYCWLLELQ